MTIVEELREAARLMKERAQAATEGPWTAWAMGSEGYLVLRTGGTVRERGRNRVGRFGLKNWDGDKADAEYVASMHPIVALAVADWLDKIAWSVEIDPDLISRVGGDETLAVARAYLGGDPS